MSETNAIWYVSYDGNCYGPYPAEQLASFLKERRVPAKAMVCQGNSGQWLPAGTMEPFASAIASLASTDGQSLPVSPRAAETLPSVPPAIPVLSPTLQMQTPAPQVNVQVDMAAPLPGQEQTIWQGRSSLMYYVWKFLWCGAWLILWLILASRSDKIMEFAVEKLSELIPDAESYLNDPRVKDIYLKYLFLFFAALVIFRIIWLTLAHLNTYYVISTQRIKIRTGIFSLQHHQIEMFRIKDFIVSHPFWGRIFGYSHIRVLSSDRFVPDQMLVALPGGIRTADRIRQISQAARSQSGMVAIGE